MIEKLEDLQRWLLAQSQPVMVALMSSRHDDQVFVTCRILAVDNTTSLTVTRNDAVQAVNDATSYWSRAETSKTSAP